MAPAVVVPAITAVRVEGARMFDDLDGLMEVAAATVVGVIEGVIVVVTGSVVTFELVNWILRVAYHS